MGVGNRNVAIAEPKSFAVLKRSRVSGTENHGSRECPAIFCDARMEYGAILYRAMHQQRRRIGRGCSCAILYLHILISSSTAPSISWISHWPPPVAPAVKQELNPPQCSQAHLSSIMQHNPLNVRP